MYKIKLCLAASIFLWGTFSYAETLFVDDFENGLDKWSGKNSAVPTAKIVDDPINSGHGKVITFTKKVIEGDIYTKTIINNLPTNKPYILEFDYLGIPVRKSKEGNGGYIGYSRNTNPGSGASNHRWVGGTKDNYSIYRGDQYQFLKDNGQWNHYKVDLSATDFPDFVLMLEDYLYAGGVAGDAYFDNISLTDSRGPSDFKLTVFKEGNGQVNSIPEGIDCNTDCEESYTDGTDVTLIVTPDINSTFVNWQGDCNGNSVITMDANKNCTAIFEKQFKLTVNKIGNGKVHSNTPGINCGANCNKIYNDGSIITLIVTPDIDSTFTGWQGDCNGNKNSIITIDKNKTCTANFEKQFKLTVNKTGNGEIHSTTPGINCGTDCNETYNDGSIISLIATPNEDSTFIGWQGDCDGDKNSTITIDTNKSCTAIFEKQHQLTVIKKGNGQVNSVPEGIDCNTDCEEKYTDRTGVTLIVTPYTGSTFSKWQDDCSGDNNIIVTMDKNKTCTAIFEKQFQLIVDKTGNGEIHSTTPGINCGKDCNEIYNDGSTVTLIATPGADFTFISWQGDCDGDGDKNATLIIDANKNCTAIFDERFQLKVGKIGDGTIHSDNQGIDCGTDCKELYNDGSIINLIATPDTNSIFTGWTGDCNGDKNSTITINSNKTCTAVFDKQFQLTVDKIGNGKIHSTTSGINCGTDCNEFYNDGSTITLVATPDINSVFNGWTGDCSGDKNTVIIIDADKKCIANFEKQFKLTVDKTGNGKIHSTIPGIDCGTDCREIYKDNPTVTLIATPDADSTFIGWQGDCSGEKGSTITIDANKNCTAVFDERFQLTVNKIGDGKVHSEIQGIDCGTDCNELYNNGSIVTLIATPDTNSTFTGWTGDCNGNKNSTISINSNKNCTAVFDELLELTVEKIGNGKIHSTTSEINCGTKCNQLYDYGSKVTVIATPDKNSVFTGWQGDCIGNENNTLTMDTNKTCVAVFKKQFHLIVNKTGNGTIRSTTPEINCGMFCNEFYNDGSTVTLIATPDKESTFTGWIGDCMGNEKTIITIDADKNCTAIFKKQFQLTVNKTGNGKIHTTIPGIDCGTDCNKIYDDGSTVTLIATPDINSRFTGWQGDCNIVKVEPATESVMGKFKNFFGFAEEDTSDKAEINNTDPSTTVIMDANKNCTAKFTTKIPLTVNKLGNGNGVIKSSISGINCGTDCNESYADNEQVELTATPDSNSVFIGWTQDCNGNNPATTVTMNKAKTCTANFKAKFVLKVNKIGDGNGQIIANQIDCGINCTSDYVDGTEIMLTATPDENSIFTGWQDACTGTDSSTNVLIDQAKTCTAIFEKVEYCKELPKTEVGVTFSAKLPNKPGKYYIVPADVAESCLKIIESSTVLIIEKVAECQPKTFGK